MATARTTDSKVTPGEIIASTQRFSNQNDDTRKYDISVDVNISGGVVQNFNTGTIKQKDSEGYGNATFSSNAELSYFNFSSNSLSEAQIKESLNAALEFINDIKSLG